MVPSASALADHSNQSPDDFDSYSGLIRFASEHDSAKTKTVVYNPFYQLKVDSANSGNSGPDSNEQTTKSSSPFSNGDKVQFNLCTCARTNKQYAVNIKLVEQRKEKGFITMLKDNYGFIEISVYQEKKPLTNGKCSVSRDIFFHFRYILPDLLLFFNSNEKRLLI
jgi:hypothetical protein